MMITLLLYSPLISFLAVNLLFISSDQDQYWHKIYAAIFLFLSLIASSYLALISYDGSIIISKTIHLSTIPLFITIQGSLFIFLIIIIMNLSLLLLIFFTHKNFILAISIYSLMFAIISISLLSPDKLIKLAVFSMGSIIITLMLLIFNKGNYLFIIIDFFLQRISDFLGTLALILMMIEKNNITTNNPFLSYNAPRSILLLAFFLSVFIRVISSAWPQINANKLFISQMILAILKTYMGLGIITLLKDCHFHHHHILITYILLMAATIITYFYIEKICNNSINYLYLLPDITLLMSMLLIYFNLNYIAISLIMLQTILLPMLSINININNRSKKLISYKILTLINSGLLFIYSPLKLLTKTIYVLCVNILGQFYFGLLFYYFPRVIVWSLNMPLRFFHNGNIETSLIFMIMTIFIYWYIWR